MRVPGSEFQTVAGAAIKAVRTVFRNVVHGTSHFLDRSAMVHDAYVPVRRHVFQVTEPVMYKQCQTEQRQTGRHAGSWLSLRLDDPVCLDSILNLRF